MKLVDTVIDETSVELTFSDAPPGIHGELYVKVRMPLQGTGNESLHWHQLRTLQAMRELLKAEMIRLNDEIAKD